MEAGGLFDYFDGSTVGTEFTLSFDDSPKTSLPYFFTEYVFLQVTFLFDLEKRVPVDLNSSMYFLGTKDDILKQRSSLFSSHLSWFYLLVGWLLNLKHIDRTRMNYGLYFMEQCLERRLCYCLYYHRLRLVFFLSRNSDHFFRLNMNKCFCLGYNLFFYVAHSTLNVLLIKIKIYF